MLALVAVMTMVSIGTFSWNAIPNLNRHPWTSSIVMRSTVIFVDDGGARQRPCSASVHRSS